MQHPCHQVPGAASGAMPQVPSVMQHPCPQVSGAASGAMPQVPSVMQHPCHQAPGAAAGAMSQVSGAMQFPCSQVPGAATGAMLSLPGAVQNPCHQMHSSQGIASNLCPQGSGASSGNLLQASTVAPPVPGWTDPIGGSHGSVGELTAGLQGSGMGRGRGEFEPGDRTFWDLPRLAPVHEAGAAVRASDWLYRSTLLLRDLSSRSWQWFDRVYEAALAYYSAYQQSDPLQRGQLKPELPQDLKDPMFARLESRAVQMFLQALPESVVNQATATRTLSTVGLLYQVLKQYQPGGLHERAELLRSLTESSVAQNAGDAVLLLQQWFRHVSRARGMNIQLPDSSLLLAGLDGLSKVLLAQHTQVAFRLSLSRHSLRLDYQASVESVEEYAKVMLAEFEVLSLASEPKKPKLRRVKEKDTESSPDPKMPPKMPPTKGQGKSKGVNAEVPAQERPAGSSTKPCLSWMSPEGCKYGDRCRFVHNVDDEAMRGRCFVCSAEGRALGKQLPSQGSSKG